MIARVGCSCQGHGSAFFYLLAVGVTFGDTAALTRGSGQSDLDGRGSHVAVYIACRDKYIVGEAVGLKRELSVRIGRGNLNNLAVVFYVVDGIVCFRAVLRHGNGDLDFSVRLYLFSVFGNGNVVNERFRFVCDLYADAAQLLKNIFGVFGRGIDRIEIQHGTFFEFSALKKRAGFIFKLLHGFIGARRQAAAQCQRQDNGKRNKGQFFHNCSFHQVPPILACMFGCDGASLPGVLEMSMLTRYYLYYCFTEKKKSSLLFKAFVI